MRLRFSIRQRIAFIFTLLVLLLLVISAVALLFTRSAENTVTDVRRGSDSLTQLDDFRIRWLALSGTLNSLLLTREEALIDNQLIPQQTDFENRLAALRTSNVEEIKNHPEETQTLVSLSDELLTHVNEIPSAVQAGEWTRAQSILHTDIEPLQGRFIDAVNELHDLASSDVDQNLSDSTTTQDRFRTFVFAISIGGVIVALIIAALTTLSITQPLANLTAAARAIREGDLSKRAEVTSRDELGDLAQSFNNMTEQLQTSISSLESRVQSRTRDLEAVFAVNSQIGTLLEVDRLLQDVSDLIKERFNLYHAHIFMFDPEEDALILTAGAGHVGRQMVTEGRIIKVNSPRSIVARAARTRKGVVVNDVTEAPEFLPHPSLPNTRSELAAPLIARGRILGVLDVQSSDLNHFSADTLSLMELLASQVAVALSNATLYEVAERTSRRERTIGNITQKIQTAVSIDEILQSTIRELGKALRVPHTAIELRLTENISLSPSDEEYDVAEQGV
ncbi:MAG: GAF domain-containing protein [Chloroflexi bacterium]|nr:GAF domain-containing protein [Chloroflexota bacterium]